METDFPDSDSASSIVMPSLTEHSDSNRNAAIIQGCMEGLTIVKIATFALTIIMVAYAAGLFKYGYPAGWEKYAIMPANGAAIVATVLGALSLGASLSIHCVQRKYRQI